MARQELPQWDFKAVCWVTWPLNGQLKQRARVRAWAANDASAVQRCIMARCAPAAHHGALWRARALASSRRKASVVRLMRPLTSTPAAPGLPEFRVSPAFAVDCLCQGEARLLVSPRTRLAIPTDRAHDGCVHGDLCALP